MNSLTFSVLFVSFLLLTIVLKLWLNTRHIGHILRHRGQVPVEFADKISLESHQKAADYTIAKTKLRLILLFVNATVLLGFTLFGGLQAISSGMFSLTGPGMYYQIGLMVAFFFASGLIDLPFDYYYQFVLEKKFGFNKMKLGLWLNDMLKNTMIIAALGLPLLWVLLYLMDKAGQYWWLYAWAFVCIYMLMIQVLYPSLIAPLFNKFTPLTDENLKQRLEGLMQRVDFASKGLFVMDGSKRTAHGNALFSGFGSKKRVVFYDTLLNSLAPAEVEAVLAHELGHFKLKHILKRIATMFVMTLVFFFALGIIKEQAWFYTGLGVNPILVGEHQNDAMALILFMLASPVFLFVFSPLTSYSSRKHEFEADAFAAKHSRAQDLIAALVKMYDDNASTVTPDPLHSRFYDSHPPAAIRIGHLRTLLQ